MLQVNTFKLSQHYICITDINAVYIVTRAKDGNIQAFQLTCYVGQR